MFRSEGEQKTIFCTATVSHASDADTKSEKSASAGSRPGFSQDGGGVAGEGEPRWSMRQARRAYRRVPKTAKSFRAWVRSGVLTGCGATGKLARIMLAACLVALVAPSSMGCTDESGARHALRAAGYTDIETTGYSFFSCSNDDGTCTGFTAKGPTGVRVTGAVGCGFWPCSKNCTVRIGGEQ